MNIDVTRLKNHLEEYILIDTTCLIPEEYIRRTDLLKLSSVTVKGTIYEDVSDELALDLSIEGVMTLPCSITLKPVDVPFSLKVEGVLREILEEIDENAKKVENSIDILPIIWENIFMEIPMKVVSPDAPRENLAGDGWNLITREDQ